MLKSIQKNEICKIHTDTQEQYYLLYQHFIKLYNKHIPYGSKLNSEQPLIYATFVKQFFLDNYLVSEDYFSAVLKVINKEEWIDVKLFVECVEALQMSLFSTVYYYFVSPSSGLKTSLYNQKLVCKRYTVFFKMVDVRKQKSLNYLQLCEAFRMAFTESKEAEVVNKAHEIFQKLNFMKKIGKKSLCFEELVSIL
jgi:hypothetical protein